MTSVSVVIPCFNSERFIGEAINSVLLQRVSGVEIIVVDDGSSDKTIEIVSGFPSVRIFRQEHGGACRARNRGIKEAVGEWIKFLDSDDLLAPGALARQLDFATAQGRGVITYWDLEHFNDNIGRRNLVRTALPDVSDQVLSLIKSNIQTSCPLYRRSILQEVGGFDERFLKAQEYELNIRLALNGFHFLHLPVRGSLIREHNGPHRISNRAEASEMIENGQLRQRVILQQIRAAHRGTVPMGVQIYYCQGAFNRGVLAARYFDRKGLVRAILTIVELKPYLGPLLVGLYFCVFAQVAGVFRHLRKKIFDDAESH